MSGRPDRRRGAEVGQAERSVRCRRRPDRVLCPPEAGLAQTLGGSVIGSIGFDEAALGAGRRR